MNLIIYTEIMLYKLCDDCTVYRSKQDTENLRKIRSSAFA